MVEACRTIAMGKLCAAISEVLLKALARKRTVQPSPAGSTLHSGARWGARSIADFGIPGGNRQGRLGWRDVDPRPRSGIRQHMDGTFRSIDRRALALGMLVDEDVVSQVKGLQCETCGKQSQQCDLGESGTHVSRYRDVPARNSTYHVNPGQARALRARPAGRRAGVPPDTKEL